MATILDLALAVAGELDLADPRGLTLFGHSMGSLVAYEVARVLTGWAGFR